MADSDAMQKGQLDMAYTLLQRFLTKVDIKVEGNTVYITNILEFPSAEVAKTFAESYKATLEGGVSA